MTTNRKKRVCVRLPADLFLKLKFGQAPMTATINDALFNLVHDLQADRLKATIRKELTKHTKSDKALISCQFRLEAMAVEYLQFNAYNLTTCIKYALQERP